MIERFDNLIDIKFVSLMECNNFVNFRKQFPDDLLTNLVENHKLFEKEKIALKTELTIIYSDEQFLICSPQQILQILTNDLKDVFPHATKLIMLICTLPIASASVERHFSCLKRIKTYLRNSINQDRLSDLALMSIEKSLLNNMTRTKVEENEFYEKIINSFLFTKNRTLELIYKV
nr:unnamed protein product [Callosobruchus analis]